MDLKDYWLTLRRRWRIVAVTLGAVLAVAALLTFNTTPQYASSTRLFISTGQASDESAYTGNLAATQRVTSYADLVSSRELAERVVDRLQVDVDVEELPERVEATVVPETVLLEIDVTDPDPVLARDLAQAYAEELQTLVDELETPEGKREAPIKATIVDDAQAADDPVSPDPVRNLVLAAVLGLMLGIGLAVARELLDTSIRANTDVTDVTTAPILANIVADDAAMLPPSETLKLATGWAESFRVLRTNMQYVEIDEDQKVIVMTSALPGEGKSTVAINLSLSMALADRRVALVECDLRRPRLAPRLDLDGAVGTTSVLLGKVSLDDALQPYGDRGLQVLLCGPVPPNPSELLQSHAMETLLSDLRARFDIIILDAPPLLPVTDAALLANQADGAVVVVRHKKTTRDQLAHALERLEAVGSKALGIVVNRSPASSSSGGYGYGYGYGYGDVLEQAGGKRTARETKEQVKARTKAAKADKTPRPKPAHL